MPHRIRRQVRWLPLACLVAAVAPAKAEPRRVPGWRTQVIAGADASAPALQVLVARDGNGDVVTPFLSRRGMHRSGAEASASRAAEEELQGHTITVTSTPRGWLAQEEQAGLRRGLILARGQLRGAVLEDMRDAGLPSPLAHELIRALGHEVDFPREFRRGDGFAVLFTKPADRHSAGELLHAEFTLAGRRLALWRYDTERGPEWFDESGRSLRRAFLRTPLDGAQVTSAFGMRSHPVLGFTRMHQGVDFAAPNGTPIYASADGVVKTIGRAGGYGRMIMLDHGSGRETRYAHLSRFAPGLKPGNRVRQGMIIGYVGSTGLATGPHLHYEVIEAGQSVDPARIRSEPAMQLAGDALATFQATRHSLETQIAALAPMQDLAAAE